MGNQIRLFFVKSLTFSRNRVVLFLPRSPASFQRLAPSATKLRPSLDQRKVGVSERDAQIRFFKCFLGSCLQIFFLARKAWKRGKVSLKWRLPRRIVPSSQLASLADQFQLETGIMLIPQGKKVSFKVAPRLHLASVFLGVLKGNGYRGKENLSNFDKEIDEIDFTT